VHEAAGHFEQALRARARARARVGARVSVGLRLRLRRRRRLRARLRVHEAAGHFEQAVGALARVRALRHAALGPEDIKFAGSCFNPAGLLVRQAGAEAGAARRGVQRTLG
jgi:hypothetical protein